MPPTSAKPKPKKGKTSARAQVRAAPAGARPKPTPRKKAPKGGLEASLGRATQAMRKEYERVRAKIAGLRAQGSAAFDELYEEVGRIVSSDPPLFLAGGHRSLESFVQKELPGETPRSVKRNILVAESFSPEDEAKHGIAFLEEVALYAKELAGASEVPRAIDLDRLKLSVRDAEGRERKKAVRQATVDEVRRARRGLGKGATRRPGTSPIEKAVRVELDRFKALKPVRVRASAREATFSGVPVAELAEFARALGRVKIPIEPA